MIARPAAAVLTGFTVRRVTMILILTVVWCVLWERFSVANLLSGVLAALVVTTKGLGDPLLGGVRPVPLVRLTWVVFVDLVRSTTEVVFEIVTLKDRSSESVVAVAVPPEARRHMLFYTAAITLTPGTVVVDTDVDTGTLYIHLLHDTDVDATIAHVARLAELACLAFPVASGVEPVRSGDAS